MQVTISESLNGTTVSVQKSGKTTLVYNFKQSQPASVLAFIEDITGSAMECVKDLAHSKTYEPKPILAVLPL